MSEEIHVTCTTCGKRYDFGALNPLLITGFVCVRCRAPMVNATIRVVDRETGEIGILDRRSAADARGRKDHHGSR